MKRIYIFSGLGADERAFQNLDLTNFDPIYIRWLPVSNKENIIDYAKRLLPQIGTSQPILMGLSFGGLIAIEVAKLIATEKVILISSAKTGKEIPLYYRIAGSLQLQRVLPTRLLVNPSRLANWMFGITTSEDKKLLADILHDTDPHFLKWAITQIVEWSNKQQISNLVQIHGTADRILPFRKVRADIVIANGGHFMVVNRSQEISKIFKDLLTAP